MKHLLDRVCVVLGAFLIIQCPLFMHQYQHQLAGHVAELQWNIDKMEKAASKSKKTLDQYIQKFLSHNDRDISRQGQLMALTKERYDSFSLALTTLGKTSALTRPITFLYHLNGEIAMATLSRYQPGIPFTTEGVFYAILGMIFGYALFTILSTLITHTYRFACRYSK